MNWKNKKVLVCGGAGMIGSSLSRELLKRGANITIADDLSSGSIKNIRDIRKGVDFQKVDLRVAELCSRITKDKDAVFQYAARMGGIGFITTHLADIMYDNALINLNVLEASRRNEVPLYFFSSSACVYPNYKQTEVNVVPLKESDVMPADPNEPYGFEKLFSELLCASYQHDYGMNIRIARFHNIYGAVYTAFDKEKGKAPCHIIMKAIKHPNPPFTLWGKGDATRSYCYIDDCTEMVLRLVESDCPHPINVGSDRLISVDDLATLVIKISGKSIIPLHDLSMPEGVKGRNADLTLCEEVLKWRPQISLEDGMKRTYLWAVEHYDELENI